MWLSRHKGRQFKPDDCLARYLVTKKSWRGSYPRILLLCVTGIDTQDPAGFRITNSYRFDADVESISIGSDAAEFILSVRQDSKVRGARKMSGTETGTGGESH